MVDPLQKLDKLKRIYQPQDVIIGEGEVGGEFYILLDGKADIYIGERKIAQITSEEGAQFFGELASIMEEARSASVVAAEKCVVLCIPGPALDKVLALSPTLLHKLLKQLAARIKELNKRENNLDHNLNEAQETLELKLLKTKNYVKGVIGLLEIVAAQTDNADIRKLSDYMKESNPFSVRSGSTSYLDMGIVRKVELDNFF